MSPRRLVLAGMLLAVRVDADVALEARLDGSQVTSPAPNPAAAGRAELTLARDGTVAWELRVHDLTGFATATVVRHVATGALVATLTNPPATGTHVGTFGPLGTTDQAALAGGALEVQVATAANPGGEISGRIVAVRIPGRTCTCAGVPARSFRACVARALRRLPAAVRHLPEAREVRRTARRAACGAPPARVPAQTAACHFPLVPFENVVVDPLCAQLTPAACARSGGRPGGVACGADAEVTP